MAGTQGGFGVSLKIMISTTLTAITKIVAVTFPNQKKEVADVTAHDSPSGYREFVDTGLRELTEFTATILWDDVAVTHAAVLTAFAATTAVSMSIQDPDGNEIIAFSAFITQVGRISEMTDGYKAQVTIRPTGAPTIT